MFSFIKARRDSFLSTPSARRATAAVIAGRCRAADFYPRPPRGGRPKATVGQRCYCQFLSTPSARRATWTSRNLCSSERTISIHALREEGDRQVSGRPRNRAIFLSTPSARRATSAERLASSPSRYFYPRPPRGGRRPRTSVCAPLDRFLSTPSARRATAQYRQGQLENIGFLSTPSARRATGHHRRGAGCRHHFYPRPPRGGRRNGGLMFSVLTEFLSTPSARRATRSWWPR